METISFDLRQRNHVLAPQHHYTRNITSLIKMEILGSIKRRIFCTASMDRCIAYCSPWRTVAMTPSRNYTSMCRSDKLSSSRLSIVVISDNNHSPFIIHSFQLQIIIQEGEEIRSKTHSHQSSPAQSSTQISNLLLLLVVPDLPQFQLSGWCGRLSTAELMLKYRTFFPPRAIYIKYIYCIQFLSSCRKVTCQLRWKVEMMLGHFHLPNKQHANQESSKCRNDGPLPSHQESKAKSKQG
jgi:hypothetical protein